MKTKRKSLGEIAWRAVNGKAFEWSSTTPACRRIFNRIARIVRREVLKRELEKAENRWAAGPGYRISWVENETAGERESVKAAAEARGRVSGYGQKKRDDLLRKAMRAIKAGSGRTEKAQAAVVLGREK